MGGICGWIGMDASGPVGPAGTDAAKQAMLRALSHRRDVVWLDSTSSPPVALDSSFNRPLDAAALLGRLAANPTDLPSGLEGSFAVAAYDAGRGRLLLARDPFGEKPLYYTVTPSGVAFASEIKALRAARVLGEWTVSAEAVDSYLAFTYIPAPRTIFEEVHKVPGGHCVAFDLAHHGSESARRATAVSASGARTLEASDPETMAVTRYWRLPDSEGREAGPKEMLEELAAALCRRLPHEPGCVAAFLSGGLDSSVVVALLARELSARIPTFSIGFPERGLDESIHARRVADLLGCDHHEVLLDEVGTDLATAVIEQLDEPMADAATLPTFVLAREAARGSAMGESRVVLTGDGADALLAGDHWFRRLRRLDRLERLPRAARAALALAAGMAGPRQRRRQVELVALTGLPLAERYLRVREKWSPAERLEIYCEAFRRRLDVGAAARTYLDAPIEWLEGRSVEAAIRLDTIHGLPEDLLMKADKMTMAHGIESRSPFMDRRFAEWAARLAPRALLNGSVSKVLLKKAAVSLLPRDLVYRRKHGFQVPVGRWMKGSLRELTEAAFSPALIRRQEIFDVEALVGLRRRFESGRTTPALDGKVWQIVAFQTWWRGALG